MTMDARKQRVLQAIVALYGLEGEPVGSSVLANYFDMAVSSATLRNEMAALTKLGLLEQPHTSAGRVPSAKGYRYYLDHLLTDDQPLDRVTRARVDAVFRALEAGEVELDDETARLVRRHHRDLLRAGAGRDVPKVAGDAMRLPFADASFDAATISFGLRNVQDTGAGLREMARVVKPGGRLAVVEFSTPVFPPFRAVYMNYLMRAPPRIATSVSSNPDAYVYLAESIREWPDQWALKGIIEANGWERCTITNLTGGIAAIHLARKAG